jgi:hypothetical protein
VQDNDLHVWRHDGAGSRLLVSFSGIGRDLGAVPSYEFARGATGAGKFHALFVSDPNRTWLNGDGLVDRIVRIIEDTVQDVGATEVCTLGHSMGGYTAAVISGFTKVDVAICLSPQASVHPDVVPDEKRWGAFRDKIDTHHIRSVHNHLSEQTLYYVFFGQHGREAPQRDRFPLAPNIKFFVMPKTVHNTPQRMKGQGILDDIILSACQKRTRLIRRLLKDRLNARQITEPTEAMVARMQEMAA